MQGWFGEYNVTWQRKSNGKADTKSYDIGGNAISDVISSPNMKVLFVEDEVQAYGIQYRVKHRIGAPTRQIAKSLSRNPTRERPMKKIYNPNYDMS